MFGMYADVDPDSLAMTSEIAFGIVPSNCTL